MRQPTTHVHHDSKITIDRVDAFAEASRSDQLAALTELRRKSGDDSNDTQTSIMVAIFGVIAAVVIAPRLTSLVEPSSNLWVTGIVVGLTAAFSLGIAAVPVVVGAFRQAHGRERAALWLRTYEAELERRWQLSGKAARQWRARH